MSTISSCREAILAVDGSADSPAAEETGPVITLQSAGGSYSSAMVEMEYGKDLGWSLLPCLEEGDAGCGATARGPTGEDISNSVKVGCRPARAAPSLFRGWRNGRGMEEGRRECRDGELQGAGVLSAANKNFPARHDPPSPVPQAVARCAEGPSPSKGPQACRPCSAALLGRGPPWCLPGRYTVTYAAADGTGRKGEAAERDVCVGVLGHTSVRLSLALDEGDLSADEGATRAAAEALRDSGSAPSLSLREGLAALTGPRGRGRETADIAAADAEEDTGGLWRIHVLLRLRTFAPCGAPARRLPPAPSAPCAIPLRCA